MCAVCCMFWLAPTLGQYECTSVCLSLCVYMHACGWLGACLSVCAYSTCLCICIQCLFNLGRRGRVGFMLAACLYWQPTPAPNHPAEAPRSEEVLGSFVNKAPGLSVSQPKCRPFLLRINRGTEGRPLPLGTVTQIQHTTTSSPGARGLQSSLPLSLTPGHRTWWVAVLYRETVFC